MVVDLSGGARPVHGQFLFFEAAAAAGLPAASDVANSGIGVSILRAVSGKLSSHAGRLHERPGFVGNWSGFGGALIVRIYLLHLRFWFVAKGTVNCRHHYPLVSFSAVSSSSAGPDPAEDHYVHALALYRFRNAPRHHGHHCAVFMGHDMVFPSGQLLSSDARY